MATDGLLGAHVLDGAGRSRAIGWDGVDAWRPEQGVLWLHLDHAEPAVRSWLAQKAGLDEAIVEALTAEEPRPRSVVRGEALLVILRGVNLNPGADPEDMVSIRLWVEATRVISLRHRRVMAVGDLEASLATGNGPRTAGEFLVEICSLLADRMSTVLSDLDCDVDSLEDEVLTAERHELRSRIGEARRQAIGLHRYLAPQRDAVTRLYSERVPWLTELDRAYLREVADRVTRYVEDLDSIRDRAAVAQDTLNGRLSEQMNRNMYVLSVVAAIFLPLGLLTGLLGINVKGIPGEEDPAAFAIVCSLLVVIAIAEIWFFRRKRLI